MTLTDEQQKDHQMSKLIAAYTPPTSPNPPFVNITRESDGSVSIFVRSPPRPGEFSNQDCGPSAKITLTRDEWINLFAQIDLNGRPE